MWGDAAAAAEVAQRCGERLDVVLGADVGYDPATMVPLSSSFLPSSLALSDTKMSLVGLGSSGNLTFDWFG